MTKHRDAKRGRSEEPKVAGTNRRFGFLTRRNLIGLTAAAGLAGLLSGCGKRPLLAESTAATTPLPGPSTVTLYPVAPVPGIPVPITGNSHYLNTMGQPEIVEGSVQIVRNSDNAVVACDNVGADVVLPSGSGRITVSGTAVIAVTPAPGDFTNLDPGDFIQVTVTQSGGVLPWTQNRRVIAKADSTHLTLEKPFSGDFTGKTYNIRGRMGRIRNKAYTPVALVNYRTGAVTVIAPTYQSGHTLKYLAGPSNAKRLEAAIHGGTYETETFTALRNGDTLWLKSHAFGDQDRVPVPWYPSNRPFQVKGHRAAPPSESAIFTCMMIDFDLNVVGDVKDVNGLPVPATVLTIAQGYDWVYDEGANLTTTPDGMPAQVQGGSALRGVYVHADARASFRNLHFKRFYRACSFFSPVAFDGCWIEEAIYGLIGSLDYSYAYPNLSPGIREDYTIDPSSVLRFVNGRIFDMQVAAHHYGSSGELWENNVLGPAQSMEKVYGTPEVIEVYSSGLGPAFRGGASIFYFFDANGNAVEYNDTRYASDNVVRGNAITNSPLVQGETPTLAAVIWVTAEYNGTVARNLIQGNTFADIAKTLPLSEGYAPSMILENARGGNRVTSYCAGTQVLENTFTNCAGAIYLGSVDEFMMDILVGEPGVPGDIVDTVIADNSFARMVLSEGTFVAILTDASPSIRSMTISGNDYRNSDLVGIREGGDGAIVLGGNYCTVKETGRFPEGTGGAENWIHDVGVQNRIVGEAANGLDVTPGIGQRISRMRHMKITSTVGETTPDDEVVGE
jgi:hypothetical protein